LLRAIAGRDEVRRHPVLGQRDELATPAGCSSDLAGPFKFGERRAFGDVVDAPGGALGCRGQREGRCNILHVAAGRSPRRPTLFKQDRGPSVVDSFQHGAETANMVARPIDHWEPQHGPGQLGITHDGALDWNLVVGVVDPAKNLSQHLDLRRRVGLKLGPER
jgi:hypothetical protein